MAKLADFPEPMSVEQFLAFYDTRPDGEKWELLDGELFINATPARPHQKIVHAISVAMDMQLQRAGGQWEIMPGIGVQLSDFSSVEPDLMIRPDDNLTGRMCDDIVVAFEILSPSTRRNDLEFKRINYASLPSLMHYVVIAPDKIEVRLYSRGNGWNEAIFSSLDGVITFEVPKASLLLADIYSRVKKMIPIPNS